MRGVWLGLSLGLVCWVQPSLAQSEAPDCSRPLTLGLHDHGLLYSAQTGTGIDRDVTDELIRRSGCKLRVSLLPRARIWQLIEAGALDFSLSGITTAERERFAAFAWYFSNKYYLLVRRDAQVQSLDEFLAQASLRLGVIRSFRYSESANRMVDQLMARQRVTQSSGLAALFEALAGGQIQAMIIEPFDYPTLDSARLRELSQIIEFGDPPVPHGLIMSRASLPEAEQQKWRALVQGMLRDGSMQRIFEKYFKPELARAMLQGLP